MKIVYFAKTNLNTDGRILNQLQILRDNWQSLDLNLILFPDKPIHIDFDDKINLRIINTIIRNNVFFRFFTVSEFVCKSIYHLFRLKPDILHVHDQAVVLPALIYRLIYRSKFFLIYDDHEIPNESDGLGKRILNYFEKLLMRHSDFIFFANDERRQVLISKYGLKVKSDYFLNLPYGVLHRDSESDTESNKLLSKLKHIKEEGCRIIIHQGVLSEERGRSILAEFSRKMPHDAKVLIIGISKRAFEEFLNEYNIDPQVFVFGGMIPYHQLDLIWKCTDAAIIMYLPTYLNNRLCAPNRFYIAVKHNIPTIVNRDNPVLNKLSKQFNSGFFIDEFQNSSHFNKLFMHKYTFDFKEILVDHEILKFKSYYNKFVSKLNVN